jgi:heat shock protein HslJ
MSWFIRKMAALAMFGAVTMSACAGAPGAAFDGTWALVSIDSRPVRGVGPDGPPRFTIKGQSIEGFDGCNQFSGRIDQPVSVASTRMGCPDGTLKLPLDLNNLQAHLAGARVEQDQMIVVARGAYAASVFKRVKA